MNDQFAPSFAMHRRDLFGFAGMAGAAAMLPDAAFAAPTDAPLDSEFISLTPEAKGVDLERIERSYDEEDVCWWYQFFFFGVTTDRSPIRLIRYEGIEMSRCRHVSSGRLEIHGNNISFPRTMDGTAWLEDWTNPYTGEKLRASDNVIDNDPGYEKSKDGIRPLTSKNPPRPLDYTLRREGNVVKLERVRVPPPEWPGQFIETSTVTVSLRDYKNEKLMRLPAQGSGMWVQPFPKWMKMDGLQGHLVGYFNGRKVGPVSSLPAAFRERLVQTHADLVTIPRSRFGKI